MYAGEEALTYYTMGGGVCIASLRQMATIKHVTA